MHRSVEFDSRNRAVLRSILSGVYTPYDVREFVRLCYILAFPLVRRRISHGRMNLESIRLTEVDLVYDCIADLFVRDNVGHFTEIEKFFRKEIGDTDGCSDALLGDTLRRIVFGKVNVNLIRVHCGADPAFGKILHNLDVALTRNRQFEKYTRFGETMLACCDSDLLPHLPIPPLDYVRGELSRQVLIHDSVPTMLKKLRDILLAQHDYQRTIPYLSAAMLLKEIYALAGDPGAESEIHPLTSLEEEDALRWVKEVCGELRGALHATYVSKGKTTEEMFEAYVQSASEILSDLVSVGSDGQRSFFEYLNTRMPQLTREEYINQHKAILEYMVRLAKGKLAKKLNREDSAL